MKQLIILCRLVLMLSIVLSKCILISSDIYPTSKDELKLSKLNQEQNSTINVAIRTKRQADEANRRDFVMINILKRNKSVSPNIATIKNKISVIYKVDDKDLRVTDNVNKLTNNAQIIDLIIPTPSLFEFFFIKNENISENISKKVNNTVFNNYIKKNNNERSTKLAFRIKNDVDHRFKRWSDFTLFPTISQNKATSDTSTTSPFYARKHLLKINSNLAVVTNNLRLDTSTVYDKIRFFEMFDIQTSSFKPSKNKMTFYEDYVYSDSYYNTKDDTERVLKQRNAGCKNKAAEKKQIRQNLKSDNRKEINRSNNVFFLQDFAVNSNAKELKYLNPIKPFGDNTELKSDIMGKNSSRMAFWSDYPFVGAYVYEPAHIHCDAAAISPHWLVAAGTCLSINKISTTEGRSAFVVYCGAGRKQPWRLNYVKYVIVHPSFHPQDIDRQFLYNIGLIRVVTSMSSCPGWAPVGLMSHQFFTPERGSKAIAVGWGLDRHTSSQLFLDQYNLPLMVYESIIFSDKCPGSISYRKAKLSDENSIKNVYCLSLPQYYGEDSDTIHGSLLLHGGNLLALYLQEERRPRGPQSAQYTGIWRVLPWITEVAQESDDFDKLLIDIL